ncbi:MAG TPA: AI-2E family transporter [Acholeplasmataceae bacterium]|jgi:predicted PurR-regulated permease PerM|nr:AI-2E family transporter [Acholeplasmataceae bacterium]
MNNHIKKLIFILLLMLTVYVTYLAAPFIIMILRFAFFLLMPFLIAFTIAFILQPLVSAIQIRVKKRWLAVVTVVAIFVAATVLIVSSILPYLMQEIRILVEKMPEITAQIEEACDRFAQKFDFLPDNYRPTFRNISAFFSRYMKSLSSLPGIIVDKFLNYVSYLVLVPMILIYFLIDYEKILCAIRQRLIDTGRIHFKNYLGELNQTISAYVRGSFLVMVILTVVCTTIFLIIGLDFAVFFASVIAITNVIPYLGPYIGAAFPVLYALISSPRRALMIALIIFIIQQLENHFLSPYIHSRRIKTHPLIVILFLLLFGRVFGILGMIFAVPVLAIVRITLKYYPPFKKRTAET